MKSLIDRVPRKLTIPFIVLSIVNLMFPPWRVWNNGNVSFTDGYHFILTPPHDRAIIDLTLLGAQALILVLVFGLSLLVSRHNAN